MAIVELEKALVLLDEQRADGYCELRPNRPPDSALPHLGLLRRMAELSQRCFIEQYSQTTSVDEVEDALRKTFIFRHGLNKTAKRARVGQPVLWVVSPGRPQQVLVGYRGQPAAGWPRGVYQCAPQLALWVVVLSELPKTAATRALRLFGLPGMQLEVLRELNALPLDDPQHAPWLDILADVRYLIEQLPDLSPEEKSIMTELRQRWEQEKAEIRAEAKAEGILAMRQKLEQEKAEIRAEAKAESILTILRARGLSVNKSLRARVLSCQDLGVLDRWLLRAATATSATDVITA